MLLFCRPQNPRCGCAQPGAHRRDDNFLKAGETGEGKAIDWNRANFADRRFFQRRTAELYVNQYWPAVFMTVRSEIAQSRCETGTRSPEQPRHT